MTSVIPAPWVVALHRYTPGSANDRGVQKRVYTPPKDEQGTLFRVQGWAPPGGGGGSEPTADRPVDRLEPFAPPTIHEFTFDDDGRLVLGAALADVGPMDLIDLPDRLIQTEADLAAVQWLRYEVSGYARDYTKGPHMWQPGKIVDLQRAIG